MKILKLVVLIQLCVVRVFAQQEYPFIQYDSNKIIHATDSSDFLAFYKKLDALKNGTLHKVTIAHYGGSHIQAGQWTEVLADSFQALGNFTGGGAFAFPYRVVNTNGPPFYSSFSTGVWKRCRCVPSELCAPLGMAGIAAVNNDAEASFGIKLRPNGHIQNYSYVKVFHHFNSSFQFDISAGFPVPYKRIEVQEFGFTLFEFEVPVDSINFKLLKIDNNQKDFILRGFSIESKDPGVYFASMGVNGASTKSYIRSQEFSKELQAIKPDLFIFSIGVNDAHDLDFNANDFAQRYDSLITMVKNVSPDCAILFTTVTDHYIKRKTANTRSLEANAVLFTLMEKNRAAVWDLFTVMGGLKSMGKWYTYDMASADKIHFNKEGYRLIGNLMFEAMMKSYNANSITLK